MFKLLWLRATVPPGFISVRGRMTRASSCDRLHQAAVDFGHGKVEVILVRPRLTIGHEVFLSDSRPSIHR